jgi:hypothetical protein
MRQIVDDLLNPFPDSIGNFEINAISNENGILGSIKVSSSAPWDNYGGHWTAKRHVKIY